jgi:hypothetical protein
MEADSERLLSPSHPARCTSAQYVDRNGKPLLFYFGRRLVRPGDRKVGHAFVKADPLSNWVVHLVYPYFGKGSVQETISS